LEAEVRSADVGMHSSSGAVKKDLSQPLLQPLVVDGTP
jgi:hypothetical protein